MMGKCEICGEEGSLREMNHEEKGKIMVCASCWEKTSEKGNKVTEGTGSDDSGLGCPHCG